MNKKVLLIGGGGHAKVLLSILSAQGIKVHAIISPEIDKSFSLFKNVTHLKHDYEILNYSTNEVVLVNGVGSLPYNSLRASIFEEFCRHSYKFMTVKSEHAIVSDFCDLGIGVQIMPGAIINADTIIGDNTIINSGAIIEHDCKVGKNNHIAPGAILCGQSTTEADVHIGTGAVLIQGVTIRRNSVVAAGASVVRDVEKNMLCKPSSVSTTPL